MYGITGAETTRNTAGKIKITYTDSSIDKGAIDNSDASNPKPRQEGKIEYLINLAPQDADLQLDVAAGEEESTGLTVGKAYEDVLIKIGDKFTYTGAGQTEWIVFGQEEEKKEEIKEEVKDEKKEENKVEDDDDDFVFVDE